MFTIILVEFKCYVVTHMKEEILRFTSSPFWKKDEFLVQISPDKA